MADIKTVSPSPAAAGEPAPAQPTPAVRACSEEAMLCERCSQAEMYRMHAVWRCPACGFKTDCCGW